MFIWTKLICVHESGFDYALFVSLSVYIFNFFSFKQDTLALQNGDRRISKTEIRLDMPRISSLDRTMILNFQESLVKCWSL